MSAPLFRSSALAQSVSVFDVHMNVLPAGVPVPQSFYSSVTLDAVLAETTSTSSVAPQDSHRPIFDAGFMSPPAGTDLLSASRQLRDRLASSGVGHWRALLRFDTGSGKRPIAGPASRLRAWRSRLLAKAGSVEQAVCDDPSLLEGFAGVKLMPQATGLPGSDALGILSERGTPILVHAGLLCPPRWLERELLPAVSGPVILAHLGSWPCSADDLAYAVDLAMRDKRVYLETSGANIGNFVRHAAERIPEQLLFGSNRPMCSPAVQFEHIAASVIDDATLVAIAHGNARRLFGDLDRAEAGAA